MKAPPDEQRHLLAIARTYRRGGYTVAVPASGDPLPAFLKGYRPTLVAERDDDHVILEIKRTDRIVGSNDLVALAELVATTPGWRFELRSLPAGRVIARPDLRIANDEISGLAERGFTRAAFIVACAAIEMTVAHAAANEGLNPANMPFVKLLREMVVRGVLPNEARVSIGTALDRRDRLMHADGDDPSRRDIDDLVKLMAGLDQEISAETV